MVVVTSIPGGDIRRSRLHARGFSREIGYRKRVTAAHPTDATAADATDRAVREGEPAAETDAQPAPETDAEHVAEADAPPTAALADDDRDEAEAWAAAQWADEERPATALTWVDSETVAAHSTARSLDEPVDAGGAGLLRGARLRPAVAGPGVLVPLGMVVALTAAYAGTTALWPLHEVAPTASAVSFETVSAPAATITWPAQGSSAVGVGGLTTTASSVDPASIASITKVVSVLMVLDRLPLALGEQGPEFAFTAADSRDFWSYRRSNQSSLDVPVGGVLTEYQMLQGTLLGSANNYIDRLARELWGSEQGFAVAAEAWLRDRGLADDMTIVTPSGFDERNTATPEALVRLGEIAMKNPVFAQIVGTRSAEIPGAGAVTNTNGMLADAGVTGIKTGTLVGWNLLTAKTVTVDDIPVTLYAAVLNQDDDAQRLAGTRSLFAEVEAALQTQPAAVPAGTVVGRVDTEWGEQVDIVTDADADVILWNGAAATSSPEFTLDDEVDDGAVVGTLRTVGPLNTATTELSLSDDVEGPTFWWRLTNPIALFGLDAD